jgi:succinoglycan biosynthesis transport protein ExoP
MSLSNPNHSPLASRNSQLAVPADADPTYFLAKADPGRLLGVLFRRGWIVMVAALLGAIGLYAVANKLPKTYRATGSVQVSTQAPTILDIRPVAPEESRDLEQMRSVEQGLSATTLLLRVIEANHLADARDFAPKGASQETLLQLLASRVKVELSRGSRVIVVQVDDTDPVRAKTLVQSLVDEYEKWTTEKQLTITRKASEGLAREEEHLRAKMEESAQGLQEFRKAHPVPGLEGSDSGSPVRDSLGALSAQLTDATAARLKVEAEFEAYAKFDASNPDALAGLASSERGTEVLSQVRAIQQKEADFGRVKERYLFKHPVYKEIDNEIKLMKSNLAETVRSAGQALEQQYKVAKENELKLSGEVSLARGNAVDVEGLREQFRSMSRDAEADRTLHDSVALRLRETSLMTSVPSSVLQWQGVPLTPEKPHGPRKIVFAAVGAFGGFLAGLTLLVGLELADRKVRDPGAAARATGAPLLATLPQIEHSGDGMVLLSDPSSAGAEAFRRLRAILAPTPGSTTARTVLFASARAGEGKSFCALNYATSLAMQGHRTLLLDADLRRAGLSQQHLAGAEDESGLGGYLAGKIDPADACFTTALPNLYVLSSGPVRKDAAELLAGTRFPSLLEDAYRWFDRVVIDTSPVLAVSDLLAITRYADRTCLVVRDRGSDRRELRRAADLVRSAGGSLVGFVWNEATDQRAGSSSPGPGVPVNRPGLSNPNPVGVASAGSSDGFEIVPSFA